MPQPSKSPLQLELEKKSWANLAFGLPFAGLSAYDAYQNYKAMRAAKASGDMDAARRNRNWMLLNSLLGVASVPTAGMATAIGRIGLGRLVAKGGAEGAKAAAKLAEVPGAVSAGSTSPAFMGNGRVAGAWRGTKALAHKAVEPVNQLFETAYRGASHLVPEKLAPKMVRMGEWAEDGFKLPANASMRERAAHAAVTVPHKMFWSWPGMGAVLAGQLAAPHIIGENPIMEQAYMPKASSEDSGRLKQNLMAALIGGGTGMLGGYLAGGESPWTSAALGATAGVGLSEGERMLHNWANSPDAKPLEMSGEGFIPEENVSESREMANRLYELTRPPARMGYISPMAPPPVFNSDMGLPYDERGGRNMLADAIRHGQLR